MRLTLLKGSSVCMFPFRRPCLLKQSHLTPSVRTELVRCAGAGTRGAAYRATYPKLTHNHVCIIVYYSVCILYVLYCTLDLHLGGGRRRASIAAPPGPPACVSLSKFLPLNLNGEKKRPFITYCSYTYSIQPGNDNTNINTEYVLVVSCHAQREDVEKEKEKEKVLCILSMSRTGEYMYP